MRRRAFIKLIAGATVAWPFLAQAQQNKIYRVGYLSPGVPAKEAPGFDAFRKMLAALRYIEGRNLVIEERWLNGGKYEQLITMAAELVDRKVDVIVTYSTPGVSAAQRATTTIPIVFLGVGDAVAAGLVPSLSRPGGNVTGSSYLTLELASKRLELLKEAMPGLSHAAALFNSDNPATKPIISTLRSRAQALQLALSEFAMRAPVDQEATFAAMINDRVDGFVNVEDPVLIYNTEATANLGLKYRLAGCGFPEFARAGGFLAYGIDFIEMCRHGAIFVDKILRGAKPADLPVEQPTKFVTLINSKTAKAIGVEPATSLLVRAEEVIQ